MLLTAISETSENLRPPHSILRSHMELWQSLSKKMGSREFFPLSLKQQPQKTCFPCFSNNDLFKVYIWTQGQQTKKGVSSSFSYLLCWLPRAAKVPSYSCPLAESHPGPWGLQEAGKQVGGCPLQSLKKKNDMLRNINRCVCIPVHVYADACVRTCV